MVHFLINRPIAVTMTFLSILILGVVSLYYIPVSLMPDIDIPEVSVQVYAKNTSARELENTVVKPLRRQLLQTSHLADIKSETRDEQGTISLRFDYGTDIDYAFIEVNEKIDRAMSGLPRSIDRPRAIKASATDIPVFYLNLTLKNVQGSDVPRLTTETQTPEPRTWNDEPGTTSNHVEQPETTWNNLQQPETKSNELQPSAKFMELSRFAENVIRKRIEQLPQVSLVDMGGMLYSELLILPKTEKIHALGISLADLEQLIQNSNIKLGNLLIRDGQYQYNVQVDSEIKDIRDINNLYLNKEGRIFKLSDLAEVIEHPQKRQGMVTVNGKDAISMAVIKQGDVQMGDLKTELKNLVEIFQKDYPHISFEISRDQTRLLDFAIVNLSQGLVMGICLAFLVMFFFLKDFRSPLLIGISVPVSLVITLLFFYLTGVTVNIISLSGLILGVGMMVDNSIIVIDNITQYRDRGFSLAAACNKATVEVFRPLLSSVLTTCAVFVPLIFLSGISGALFFDQAMAVSIGLLVSLVVSVTLLPVYYKLFYKREKELWLDRKIKSMNTLNYERLYESGFRWVMRHQKTCWGMVIILIVAGILMYQGLPKSRLPEISRTDFIVDIDWNERINVEENRARTDKMFMELSGKITQYQGFIGSQQFLLKAEDRSASESSLYINTASEADLDEVMQGIEKYIALRYPLAVYSFAPADNIFDLIFAGEEAPLVARLQAKEDFGNRANNPLQELHDKIGQVTGHSIAPIAWQDQLVLKIDPVKIKMYEIPLSNIISTLQSAFNEKEVLLITSSQEFVPVILGGQSRSIDQVIAQTMVVNSNGQKYPLRDIISTERRYDLKTIIAGSEGEYFPVSFYEKDEEVGESEIARVIEDIQLLLAGNGFFRAEFSGSIFQNKGLIYELAGVLLISLLLLYFILASQFESVTIPLIVLFEIPVGIFAPFLFLKLFGSGINLMSMIGIVVMSGIIINDSILKIDTINQLRKKEGMPLLKSLLVAGQRRLKPILMTSLTTILALLPVLFSGGLGADLQKPLALAVIGGMIAGTIVSLFFIPLCYFYLEKTKKHDAFH